MPLIYDGNLGPVWFAKYALDMAARAATSNPARVLETACDTGIVTRALRNALPRNAPIIATDFSHDMLKVAQRKFASDESVEFQPQTE